MKFLQKTLQDHLSLVIWASQRIHLPSRRCGFDLWSGRSIPWRRKWGNCNPTPVLLPGNSHRQRSLEGYSPWGRKESDTTEQLNNKLVFRCLRISRTKQRNSMQVIQVAPHSRCCWLFQHQASPCPQEGFYPSSFIAAKLCEGMQLTRRKGQHFPSADR